MSSPFLGRPRVRVAAALLTLGLSLLPGACGGSIDIVFVGSDDEGTGGSSQGGLGGEGGQGGAPGTGGAGTGGSGGGSGGTILASCGDEEVDDGEDCDEGRVDTVDCDEDCTDVACGDSHTNGAANEECDSGGVDSEDCNANCTEADCGDRYTNEAAGEECDEGADPYSPGCDTDCTFAACGDGVLHLPTGEQCDDGNEDDGDGCTDECVREILIIGDGGSEADVVQALENAGFSVALAPVLEYEFDGTNPVLDEFCGVIQLDGLSYATEMPADGQTALVDYVQEGGSFLSTGWTAYEAGYYGRLGSMTDLVLMSWGSSNLAPVYALTTEGSTHPITSNLPPTFSPAGYSEYGLCKDGSTALLTVGTDAALCVDEEVGEGRVINLGSTVGFQSFRPFLDFEMERLLVNAANWMCGTSHPVPSPRMTVGSTAVASHFGYQAQCNAWSGTVCLEPYIAMNEAHVTQPVPHCIDEITTLRPMWFGDVAVQAQTWCWIATGSSATTSAVQGTNQAYAAGWMYGGIGYFTPVCDDGYGRHFSEVMIPELGAQVWSFDDFGYGRDGYFTNIECAW